MDLPDESQWDETTCQEAVCQHPQCWAAIRRIERGHPRIMGAPCKALEIEDKLPVLTIVNILDSCFKTNRCDHRRFPRITFTKVCSLLPHGSKFDSKFQGRPRKDLPDQDLTYRTDRFPKISHRFKKLPVLNLHETEIPCSYDTRNMVVVWIPEESDNAMIPAEKQHGVLSQVGKKKKNSSAVRNKSSQVLSRKRHTKRQAPVVAVPPPSPVHLLEQLSSEPVPFWSQNAMLPQDLLKELLIDDGKTTMPCPEMKIQLAMMKKTLPLEKSRPGSAISAKMYLSIHRLTLQKPAPRCPEHLKKLYCSLKTGAHRKYQHWRQQQQKKILTKKQETKKKTKNEPMRQNTSNVMVYDSYRGQINLSSGESNKKQHQRVKIEKPILKQDSTKRAKMGYFDSYLDSPLHKKNPELFKNGPTKKNINPLKEVVLQVQGRGRMNASVNTAARHWNPELKLLRILQATDKEEEESQYYEEENEETVEEEEDVITKESYFRAECSES